MTLTELITDFQEKTGRADLTTAQITKYIQDGQKYLDDSVGNNPFEEIPKLENGTDYNWWSEEYPQTLIQAAMMRLEMDYRNEAGVKDFITNIAIDLKGIDFNKAEEESIDINVMEG